tara:strand:- start:821 stop:1093 length:273 start_codon:yes stop_codon:yes gene_type:complete
METPKNQGQTIIIKQQENVLGIIGFVLSLIPLTYGGGILLWSIALILSFIALFKRPRGFAIAGFIISLVCLAFYLLALFGIALFWLSLFD